MDSIPVNPWAFLKYFFPGNAVTNKSALYMGFDLSTQQLKGLVVDSDLKLVYEAKVDFDEDFKKYGIEKGVLTNPSEGEVFAPPAMWLEAVNLVLDRLRNAGLDFSKIKGLSGAGMQHGTVFWSADAESLLGHLDGSKTLVEQLESSGKGHKRDACLVFINEYSSEVWDRPGLADPDSDTLVNNVAPMCNSTVVVIHNAGIRLVDAWIDNPNVTAVIFAHLPGQDAGRAVASILYGDAGPSGRLPYTVARRSSDYGNMLGPCQADGSLSPQCDFTEGMNVDYRGFLASNTTPRYEFGYGLTYSSFVYANLQTNINATATPSDTVTPVYTNGTTNDNVNNTAIGNGGLLSLFGSVGTITASVSNTGSVAAAEVAQLYLLIPASTSNSSNPRTRVLRGFEKVLIQPNETAQVAFNLRMKDVSTWNVTRQAWVVPSGEFGVYVGKSVLDTPLTGSFTV
ncbi:hypothetical protein B0A54_05969 [Friedmanniomyces endolithicus]|uniref:beta-glucosidase n=1 Tax=Friedmanniomyces endolithicus TaxID=329885 RepID=A0A4U0V304_9PEZI|nr:hypothetical protein B0A54_05969 [Friedmanniomyces endolithicus]